MKTHQMDVAKAQDIQTAYLGNFPYLSALQLTQIQDRTKLYREWFLDHPGIHNVISCSVLIGLFFLDYLVLFEWPRSINWEPSFGNDLAWGAFIGLFHGWIMCSMVTFSVHEGAAHNLLFQGTGKLTSWLRKISSNACRLSMADPDYYAKGHKQHHHHFATENDGSFSNFVRSKRLLTSLIPASPLMSYSDYFPWRPQEKTASRKRSSILGKLYIIFYAILLVPEFGGVFALVSLLMVGAWFSYVLDRLRESTEHLHMPLDKHNGTRQLGLGFWGLLVGGGPWGQPCHMSHHLAPGLPWYFQLKLHSDLKSILNSDQKTFFFLKPFIGYPQLLLSLFKESGPTNRSAHLLIAEQKS